jgi:hypothetical protein
VSLERILVHVCCAPDGAYVLQLLRDNYDPTAFFYNPNIHPQEEYVYRRQEMERVAAWLKVPLIEEPPDFDRWFELTEAYKMSQKRDVAATYAMPLDWKDRGESGPAKVSAFHHCHESQPVEKEPGHQRLGRGLGSKIRSQLS